MAVSRRELLSTGAGAQPPVLVCVFQRGAADGLNSVVPYGDADYYRRRPGIAVPRPGQDQGAIPLTPLFGLNPALSPLKPWYERKRLAIVHACGMPHGLRSHFDAQALLESGVIEKRQIRNTGWIGRYLAATAGSSRRPLRAVSVGSAVPAALQGWGDPLAIDDMASFAVGGFKNGGYQDTLALLYPQGMPHAAAARDALRAIDELAAANPAQFKPAHGAVYPPTPFGSRLKQAVQLIRADLGVETICIDSDGWDHHKNLPEYLALSLGDMAQSLSAFATDLGEALDRVQVLVMTEFGRRVPENGSRGTDHGTGGCAYLLGAGVLGGQVAGRWPGLQDDDLAMGEDLAITTDLRGVLVQLLQRRFRYAQAPSLFPGYVMTAIPELFTRR